MQKQKLNWGFTLLELLVVMGIIAILLVAIVPAVNSLTKSSGRKATVSLLLSSIERARSQAIRDQRPTYVAFAGRPPAGNNTISDPNLISNYYYRSLAIFEDNADPTKSKVQVTPWKTFPAGISLRTEISFAAPNTFSNATWSASDFYFTPDTANSGTLQNFPAIKFDEAGNLVAPTAADPTRAIRLRFFEGFVTGTNERPTNKANKDEIIEIAPNSGRAKYVP